MSRLSFGFVLRVSGIRPHCMVSCFMKDPSCSSRVCGSFHELRASPIAPLGCCAESAVVLHHRAAHQLCLLFSNTSFVHLFDIFTLDLGF